MKRYLSVISIFLTIAFVSGCSNINFNQRYVNANWNTVIIAPFEGDQAKIAEEEFEHVLAVSSQISVVPASLVLLRLEENALLEKYQANPKKAIIELAKIMKVDGIIFGKVDMYFPDPKDSNNLTPASASLFAKLIDINDMSIVLSSQNKSSSLFSTPESLLQDVSQKATREFQQGFDKLKGTESSSLSW